MPPITQPEIALGTPNTPVAVWCRVDKVLPDGSVAFFTLNGGWGGVFDGENVRTDLNGTVHPASLVWQGKAPFLKNHYKEAMAWIAEQIAKEKQHG